MLDKLTDSDNPIAPTDIYLCPYRPLKSSGGILDSEGDQSFASTPLSSFTPQRAMECVPFSLQGFFMSQYSRAFKQTVSQYLYPVTSSPYPKLTINSPPSSLCPSPPRRSLLHFRPYHLYSCFLFRVKELVGLIFVR